MPTLYPENTQYGASGSGNVPKPPTIRYPSLNQPAPKPRVLPKGNFGAFAAQPTGLNPAERAAMTSPDMNFPIGSPMIPGSGQEQTAGFNDFLAKQGQTAADFSKPGTGVMDQFYETPGDGTQVKTLPDGGQYIIDPNNPDKIIHSNRDFSPDQNVLIRNGLNPALYTIDHIVPLWMGGANTIENRLIQRADDAKMKDRTELALQTLFANKKITSLTEARKWMMNWKTNDVSVVADPDSYPNGRIPLDVAERAYDNWKKQAAGQPIDTGSTWKNFINMAGAIPQNLYKNTGAFYRNVLLGGGPETTSATLGKEFTKHLVNAIPFADVLVPDLAKVGQYSDPNLQKAANLMAFGGRLTGDLAIFAATAGLANAAFEGLGAVRAASALEGLTEAEKTATEAARVLKTGSSVLGSPTLGVSEVGTGQWAVPEITAKTVGMAKAKQAVGSGALMALLGQTHQQGEGNNDVASRIKRMSTDFLYGSFLGTQGHSFGGYSRVGGLTMAIGLMEGQNSKDAAVNAVTMMALHSLGHSSGNNILGLAMEDPEYAAYVKDRSTQMADAKTGIFKKLAQGAGKNLYSPDVDARMVKAAQNTILKNLQAKMVDEASQFRMAWLGDNYQYSTDRDVLQKQNAMIHDKINQVAAENDWGPEAIRAAKFQAYVSGRELYKSALPTEFRAKADLEDMTTTGKQIVQNQGHDVILDVPKPVDKIVRNLPEEMYAPPKHEELHTTVTRPDTPGGIAPLGGSGLDRGFSPARDALDYMAQLADTGRAPVTRITDEGTGRPAFLMRGVIAYEPENESAMIDINKGMDPKRIAEGSMKQMKHPENYVGMFAYGKDPDGNPFTMRVTPIARKFRIEKLNESWQRNDIPHWMDPNMNKDTISEAFKKNGLKYSLVDFVYIPETKNLQAETGKPTSFAKAYINEDVFSRNAKIVTDALNRPDVPPVDIEVMRNALVQKRGLTPVSENAIPAMNPQIEARPLEQAPEQPQAVVGAIKDDRAPAITAQPIEQPEPAQRKEPVITPRPLGFTIAEENPHAAIIHPAEVPTESAFKSEPAGELVKAADAEDYVSHRAWTEFDTDSLNKGAAKTIDIALKSTDPATDRATQLADLKKQFSKESIVSTAKEIAAKHGPANDDAAKAEFKQEIAKRFQDAGLENPLNNKSVDRSLTRLFIQAAYSRPRNIITYEDGKGFVSEARPPQMDSYLDDQVDSYVKAHPEADGIDMVYFERPATSKGGVKKVSEAATEGDDGSMLDMDIDPDVIKKEFAKNGYVMMTASGNTRHTIWGVKFKPELIGGGSIDNPADVDAFTRKFLTDVVGFNQDVSGDAVVKRSKLFNSHNPVSPIKGATFTNYIMKSPTLGELGILKDAKFSSNTSPEAIQALTNRTAYDGKIFMTKEAVNEVLEKGGYVGGRTRLKPTMASRTDAGLALQKGDVSVLDNYHKALFESILGKKIDKYDVITFEDNVKTGLESAKDGLNPSYKVLETPSEAWRFAYSHPHESTGTLSLGNILSKFNAADGLNEELVNLYKPEIDKFRSFVDEVQASKNSDDLKAIFKKYEEYGKSDFAENLYGKVKKMVDNGADTKAIGRNIDTMINRIFQDYVVAGKFIQADHLVLTPDFKSKLDPATGMRSHLGPNEIMMSEKSFAKMYGPEALKELRDGKDFHALTVRYPVTRKTALTKAKIFIAEDHGIKNLGEEQMIPSLFDTYVRKEGDFDADAFTVLKVGGAKGLPEKFVDRIEQVRKDNGDIALDPLTSFKKTPISSGSVSDTLLGITKKAIQGGTSIANTAAMNRLMPSFVENKMSVILQPSREGTREADIYFGDNLYKTVEIRNAHGKDTVKITPHYTQDDEKLVSQIMQASTDSAKSPYLADTLEAAKLKDIEDYLAKNLFDGVNNRDEMNAIQKVMFEFQTPYKISKKETKLKSNVDLFRQLDNYNQSTDAVKASGGQLTPVQEIMTLFRGQKGFDYGFGDPAMQWRTDDHGAEAVKSAFKGEYTQTEDVKKFQTFVNNAREEYTKPENSKNYDLKNEILRSISDKYDEMQPVLTPEERRSIHYWLITAPEANMQNKTQWTGKNIRDRSGFVQRLDTIFNDSPDMARAYYKGRAAYDPEVEAPAVQQQSTPVVRQIKNPVNKYTGLQKVVTGTSQAAPKTIQAALSKRPKIQ